MEFGKALTYPFEDDDWLAKLGIGLIVGLIPIVNFALTGWQVKIISNVKNDDATPLPAWDDFGGYFMKGLLVAVASFIYLLPVIIVICVASLASGGLGAALSGGDLGDDGGAVGGLMTVVLACCSCLAAIYGIVAVITLQGGIIRFADTETFSTFMEFGPNFSLVRENLGPFIMALLYVAAVGFILSLLSWTIIASLATPVVIAYFGGHILGQLSKELEAGGAMAPAAA